MNDRLNRILNFPRVTEPRYWESHIDLPQLKYARNVLKQSKDVQKKELAEYARDIRADQTQYVKVIDAYLKSHQLGKEARRSARTLTHERSVFGQRFGRK